MSRRLILALLCAIFCWLGSSATLADVVFGYNAELKAGDDGYSVHADFEIELTTRIEEALANGVSLYFLVEFELTRPRRYWLDERVISEKRQLRLSYQPLLRQFRVSTGALHRSYSTLSEALIAVGRVRGWVVAERDRLKPGETYHGFIRMGLNTAQLPKPLQVSALTNREWTLQSDWRRLAPLEIPTDGQAR